MNWRDYESLVFTAIKSRFPADTLIANQLLSGRFSGVNRQIDILARATVLGKEILAIVDCKCYSSRVDVKDVESVIGMASDVGAQIALIITNEGYTKSARLRADNEPSVNLHLDIVSTNQAECFRPITALIHHGDVAALVTAPSGWTVTPNITQDHVKYSAHAHGFLHPKEISVEDALSQRHVAWCWMEFCPEKGEGHFDSIIKQQEVDAIQFDASARVVYWYEVAAEAGISGPSWLFRQIDYVSSGYLDLTFLVSLRPGVIFWTSIVGVPQEKGHNLHRLRHIAQNLVFFHAPDIDPTSAYDYWTDLVQLMSDGHST